MAGRLEATGLALKGRWGRWHLKQRQITGPAWPLAQSKSQQQSGAWSFKSATDQPAHLR